MSTSVPPASPDRAHSASRPGVTWDDRSMNTTYANVSNATGTREEVTVVFGTNRGWKGEGQPVVVELSQRVILSPFAAKRLAQLLNGVIEDYERRFGTIAISPAGGGARRAPR